MSVDTKEKMSFADKLGNFILKYGKILAIIGIVIVIALLTIGIISFINSSKIEKSYTAINELEIEYNNLLSLDLKTETDAIDSFLANADGLILGSKDTYPGYKANYLKGLYYFTVKDYANALEIFQEVYAVSSDVYLGSLACSNAAACAENLGDITLASDLYSQIWDNYGISSPLAAKALFNSARLAENNGNIELAKATYQQLIDQFTAPYQSEYAKLAKARLVVL